MKYAIYCRKSTDTEDKQVLSLESQETELIRLAQSKNLEITEIFKESKSAKSEGRPVFNKVLELITKGKIDGIICWKLDRLARNFIDGGKIIDLLQKSTIKEIHTYEGIHLPSDNVLMLAVQLGMANQYIRDLSVNVKRGNRAKLERGEWPNHAPFGYMNDKATKTIKIDKKRSIYVVRAYELYITGGYTLKQITDVLYKEGLRTKTGNKVGKNQVHRFFINKFYCGLMERDGKVYQGNHKPIISQSLFSKAQDVLHGRNHPRPQKHFYSAQGFLRCASCNCALTVDTQKSYQYYYCTNGKGACEEHKKYMRSEYIDGLLSKMFLELKFDEELIEISYEAYKACNQDKNAYTADTLESLTKELSCLTEKELTLVDGYSSKLIREEIYKLKIKEIENKRVEINQQIKEIQSKSGISSVTLEQVKNIFLDGSRASEQYLKVGDIERRKMLEKLLSNATIKNKTMAQFQFKSPYQVLANTPKNGDLNALLRDLDSNQDTRFQKP